MSILTLFCEIDDFFLAYEKYKAKHRLPKTPPPETHGCPRKLHHSEVLNLSELQGNNDLPVLF